MVREVTDNEIKEAIFSMGDDKALGPDGFTSAFVKEAWDVVGTDVTNAIHDFFMNGRLLKYINHTIISLVPKVSTPSRNNELQAISCCKCLFKCISKIISNRIKGNLDDIVSINQFAFVPGQRISDNILLTQELICFGFHQKMVDWIMTFYVNGDLHGWFRGKRGLRGHPSSIDVIIHGLKEFKNVSGLVSSIPKSTAFFCNVPNALKTTILNSIPFAEGSLSV
ncbi:hypothetical protein Tco_0850208, partial [Tanacetum coccineum]